MGGGGVIRTAAKAAALGAGAYRSTPVPTKVATTIAARLPHSSLPTSPAPPDSSISFASSQDPPAAQRRAAWETEWEFAGGEEEGFGEVVGPAPKLVFGPVPSLDEAKEATDDLRVALEQIYFSGPISTAENLEKKTPGITESSAILSSAPRHVMQAFSLLQGSPEAQGVVASLASDENVWNAVMNNRKVIEFYKSHQTSVAAEEVTVDEMGKVDNHEDKFESSVEKLSERTENIFVGFINTVKEKVSAMVTNISDLIQNFLNAPNNPEHTTDHVGAKEVALGSFLALAVAVIMVVLVKRG